MIYSLRDFEERISANAQATKVDYKSDTSSAQIRKKDLSVHHEVLLFESHMQIIDGPVDFAFLLRTGAYEFP